MKQSRNVNVNTISINYSPPSKFINLKMKSLKRKLSPIKKFEFQQFIRLPPIFQRLNKQNTEKTKNNNTLPSLLKITKLINYD